MVPDALADIPLTPASHFRLNFYAAALQSIRRAAQSLGGLDEALKRYPFLAGYQDELAIRGLEGLEMEEAIGRWRAMIQAWEPGVPGHLPLAALRCAAGLDDRALLLLLTVGLAEEDPRFGVLFEELQYSPGQRRPTPGLLHTWWRGQNGAGESRRCLRALCDLGLVQPADPTAPRNEWALEVPGLVWDALRGDTPAHPAAWARCVLEEGLPLLEDLILPEALAAQAAVLPELLAAGEAGALAVRGPQRNGRRTLLGAVARALGNGLLEIAGPAPSAAATEGTSTSTRDLAGWLPWRLAGPLATLLHAMPVIALDLGPGETADLPALAGYDGPLGIALGRQGGLRGPAVERCLTVTLEVPGPDERRRHWERALAGAGRPAPAPQVDDISARLRLTSGNIARAAGLAASYAALDGRYEVNLADVHQASRALNRQALETLAAHVPAGGDWSHLVVDGDTDRELCELESRCRHRERLPGAVGRALSTQLTPGVRALFSGPSGTGKTLAARLLATALEMDLYRLDLSAVVNKYIGETEKNLHQVFARAEELDVILLLDEGDALLTQRTSVQTANDRYANLETNYLLQRLESFEGILIVTTNAGERIDSAFQRRMDVVISFHLPDVQERWAIWQLHLPDAHRVPPAFLEEVSIRCELTGGQIRNAVLHAALLALGDGTTPAGRHLLAGIQREYRKMGAVCPLRRAAPGEGF